MKMLNTLLLILLILLILPFSITAKEYVFTEVKSDEVKVKVQGLTYRVIRPWSIIDDQYYFSTSSNYLSETDENNNIFIILNQRGQLIRNPGLIKKILYTKEYSQLSKEELSKIFSLSDEIKEMSSEIEETYKYNKKYFSESYLPICFFSSKIPKNIMRYTSFTKDKLIKVYESFLKNSDVTISNIFIDMIYNIHKEIDSFNQSIEKYSDKTISFHNFLDFYKIKFLLSICNKIYSLNKEESILKDILEKSSSNKKNTLKKDKTIDDKSKSIDLSTIDKAGSFDKIFKQLHKEISDKISSNSSLMKITEGIDNEINNLIEEETNVNQLTIASATYFPVYGGKTNSINPPKNLLKKYKKANVLFYEDFSGNISDNWDLYGDPKPKVINNEESSKNYLSTNGDDIFYSSVASKGLFNPFEGEINVETIVDTGKGKGCFGFGNVIVNDSPDKGSEPFVGFIINNSRPGTISFMVNNEIVINKIINYSAEKPVKLNFILSYENGVKFKVNGDTVFSSDIKIFGIDSESIIFSSTSNDFFWHYVLVTQVVDISKRLERSKSIIEQIGFSN